MLAQAQLGGDSPGKEDLNMKHVKGYWWCPSRFVAPEELLHVPTTVEVG